MASISLRIASQGGVCTCRGCGVMLLLVSLSRVTYSAQVSLAMRLSGAGVSRAGRPNDTSSKSS